MLNLNPCPTTTSKRAGEDDAGQRRSRNFNAQKGIQSDGWMIWKNQLRKCGKGQLDNHKWFVTVIFTLVGFSSHIIATNHEAISATPPSDTKADTREALSAMQNQVNHSVEDMKQNFRELAGESLKKQSNHHRNPDRLFGRPNSRRFTKAKNFPLFPLFLKNIGDKQTGTLKLRLSASCDDMGLQNAGYYWRPVMSNERDLPFKYVYEEKITKPPLESPRKENMTFNGGQYLPTTYANGLTTNGQLIADWRFSTTRRSSRGKLQDQDFLNQAPRPIKVFRRVGRGCG